MFEATNEILSISSGPTTIYIHLNPAASHRNAGDRLTIPDLPRIGKESSRSGKNQWIRVSRERKQRTHPRAEANRFCAWRGKKSLEGFGSRCWVPFLQLLLGSGWGSLPGGTRSWVTSFHLRCSLAQVECARLP